MAEKKNFRWTKHEDGDWYDLDVDMYSLDLSSSLKVQEMMDNKVHQRLQLKLNRMIVLLTGFVVLGVLFEIARVGSEYLGQDFGFLIWLFTFIFVALALVFLWVALPDNWKSKLKIKKAKDASKKKSKVSSWDGIWAIIDVFVNIITLGVVVGILAKTTSGWALVFMIGVFIIWAFRPFGKLFKRLIG